MNHLAIESFTIGELLLVRTKPLKNINLNFLKSQTHNFLSNLNLHLHLNLNHSFIWATSHPHPSVFNLPLHHHHHHRHQSSFKTLSSTNSSLKTTDNFNHIIQSLCKRGNLKQALQLLPQEENPTQRTYESLILACTHYNDASLGTVVHRHIIDHGFDRDPFLSTKLIEMYSHFRCIDLARKVFNETPDKTIFVWNALLRGLALADEGEEALELIREMSVLGMPLDRFTYSFALKACIASLSSPALANGRVRELHGHLLRHGFESRVHVAMTLVDCYRKIGCVAYSQRVFDGMPERNVVTWSTMIACYASVSPFDALLLFWEMRVNDPDIVPNSVTVVSMLQACAGLSALEHGKILHAYILRKELDSIISVFNALIVLYAKCGCLEMADRVFHMMEEGRRDVVSWNSMISGYGVLGFGQKAIHLFEEMAGDGISPSSVTFVSVLGACSHAGMVQEGRRLFAAMLKNYGIKPLPEHYACMVDLLGRAGQLDEAVKIIEDMRDEPGRTVWGALLGSCRIHGNVRLAERACTHLFELEPLNAGNYILLADIYAGAQMWEAMRGIRTLLEAKGLQKLPGCSCIEVKKVMYSFVSVDGTNPHIDQLLALLERLVSEMKETGYVPNTKVILYDLDQEEKERLLLGHSEKLALAFGLINSSQGEVIRITKNLRLCEDCHKFTKLVSKFAKREIIVKDVNRFHRFRDGVCSCSDYW